MKKTDINKVFSILEKQSYDVPLIGLIKVKNNDPFRILIATILSARTKDLLTARVCENLFSKIKNFKDLRKLSVKEIEKLIYPIGFYRNKAKQLKELSKIILSDFDGKVPSEINDLVKLPGVGRKTANLVAATAFGKDAICVDTHVHKISNRLGYVKTKNPSETEIKLMEKLPKKYWKKVNYLFVMHGQSICVPISPWCSKCTIKKYCKRVGIKKSR